MQNTKNTTIFYVLLIAFATSGLTATVLITDTIFPEVQATGGAGEIKGLIDPIIDRAITALQNNNTDLALEEIQTLKGELDDTFSVDEAEEEEEEEEDDKK